MLVFFSAKVASITLLALLASALLISSPRDVNARLFAVICISLLTYLLATIQFHNDPVFQIDLSDYWLPMQFLMNTGAGCMMLLCYSLFEDRQRFPIWMLAAFAVQLCLSTARPVFVPNEHAAINVAAIGEVTFFLFGSLPILMQMIFGMIAVFWIVAGWRADLVESRRLLRGAAFGVLASFLVIGTGSELFAMTGDRHIAEQFHVAQTFAGTVMVFLVALGYLRFPRFLESVKSAPAKTPKEEFDYSEQDLARFEQVFKSDKAYLQPGLSVGDLADKMNIPQYRLRKLVNGTLGYRNFNALLNEYRIKDACQWLADPDEMQTPILTIALSVGYQSIGPFNQAFRNLNDQTPTQYRRAAVQPATPEPAQKPP